MAADPPPAPAPLVSRADLTLLAAILQEDPVCGVPVFPCICFVVSLVATTLIVLVSTQVI